MNEYPTGETSSSSSSPSPSTQLPTIEYSSSFMSSFTHPRRGRDKRLPALLEDFAILYPNTNIQYADAPQLLSANCNLTLSLSLLLSSLQSLSILVLLNVSLHPTTTSFSQLRRQPITAKAIALKSPVPLQAFTVP